MMKASILLKIYEDQLKNMNDLLAAAVSKQKSVIQNNRLSLEKSTRLEETLLSRINRKEIERMDCLQKFYSNQYGGKNPNVVNLSNLSIDELKKGLEENEYIELNKLRDSIKEVTARLMGMNQQNKFLIEQANSIVKNTLEIVLKSQKKPIVDRRV
jgi:hypothetical protein